jgi:hypothetical protein
MFVTNTLTFHYFIIPKHSMLIRSFETGLKRHQRTLFLQSVFVLFTIAAIVNAAEI